MCTNGSSSSRTHQQGWRERPPSSHSLIIQNFTQLENSVVSSEGKYESRFFSSGGYNWRMVIYPKGNDKDNGIGFISMYVEIERKSLLSKQPSEVFADLRFFIFNKKENKYFIVQDLESKLFNSLRMSCGFPQVLPLDTFKEPRSGYIFGGDQCEFGVDVIVVPPPTNLETLSFNNCISHPKFSWKLENFSKLKETSYKSSNFSLGGRTWSLKLYPKGETAPDVGWLSIFLSLANTETLKADEKIFTQAHLRVLDPFGCNHVTIKLRTWYDSLIGLGYRRFMTVAEARKAYLDKEGSLNLEIEFDVVSNTKYSLP